MKYNLIAVQITTRLSSVTEQFDTAIEAIELLDSVIPHMSGSNHIDDVVFITGIYEEKGCINSHSMEPLDVQEKELSYSELKQIAEIY